MTTTEKAGATAATAATAATILEATTESNLTQLSYSYLLLLPIYP